MSILLALFSGALGVCVGSFVNVVIWRVPAGLSVVRPPSACPGCLSPILARDNFPLASWLWLRGRCRNCRESISVRYPAVEALVGVLFALVGLRFGYGYTAAAMFIFCSGMVALAFIDFDHLVLPRRVVYCILAMELVILGLAAAVSRDWERLGRAGLCAVVAFVALLCINLINPRWLGFGDVRLAPVIGLCLGWVSVGCAVIGFVGANLLGATVGIGLIATRRAERKTLLPFGVFLAGGAVLSMFFGDDIAVWYVHRFV